MKQWMKSKNSVIPCIIYCQKPLEIMDTQSIFFLKHEDQVSHPYRTKVRQWYITEYKISCLQIKTKFLQRKLKTKCIMTAG
jgi:hypothetical protein